MSEEQLLAVIDGAVAGDMRRDGSGAVLFRYREEHLAASGIPLSLSVPFNDRDHDVSAWIDGLLPDNKEVRQRWASDNGAASVHPFDLLSTRIGQDCSGAFSFCAEGGLEDFLNRPSWVRDISDEQVGQVIRDIQEDETAWLPSGEDGAPSGAFSLAGAQSKIALRQTDKGWGVPYGSEPTTHILKPVTPHSRQNMDIVEHVCQTAARELGLQAAVTECRSIGGSRTLVVSRYDRAPNANGYSRLHQEDLCQALGMPPDRKYQNEQGPSPAQIADLLTRVSSDPAADLRRFRDALIFNWLIVGTDAHAKNHSLMLSSGVVSFAPLYDLISFLPYRGRRPIHKLHLAMKIGRGYPVRRADRRGAWESVSAMLHLPVRETLDRVGELSADLPPAIATAISGLPPDQRAAPQIAKLESDMQTRSTAGRSVSISAPEEEEPGPEPASGTSSSASSGNSDRRSRPPTARLPSRCTHIGQHSLTRCVLAAGHKSGHRYKR